MLRILCNRNLFTTDNEEKKFSFRLIKLIFVIANFKLGLLYLLQTYAQVVEVRLHCISIHKHINQKYQGRIIYVFVELFYQCMERDGKFF